MTVSTSTSSKLNKLRELLREKWPDACPPNDTDTRQFPKGSLELERLFGSKGFSGVRLLEITGTDAAGKTRFLFALLAVLAARGTILYCDRAHALFPPGLHAAGIDLERVIIVRPASAALGVRQIEQLCAGRAVVAAVLDFAGERENLPQTLLHRLRREAVKTGIAVIFLTTDARLIPPSMLSLRVGVQRMAAGRVAATVLAGRISAVGTRVELDFDA
jgi:hypothetical protein